MHRIFLVHLLLAITTQLFSQQTISLEEIMKGASFVGHLPENQRWTADGKYVVFDWNRYDQPAASTYAYSLNDKHIDSVTYSFLLAHPIIPSSDSHEIRVFTLNNALFSYDPKSAKTTLRLQLDGPLQYVQRDRSGKVYFYYNNGFYAYDLNDGSLVQRVKFKQGKAPEEAVPDHLGKAEHELFDYIREKEEQNAWKKEHNLYKSMACPIIYHTTQSISSIQIAPDGNYLLYREDQLPEVKQTQITHHLSKDGHTYEESARSKVSDSDPNHTLFIYNFSKDSTYRVDFSGLPGIRKKPAYRSFYNDADTEYPNDRAIIMHALHFDDRGLVNVCDVRSYDNKDRWLVGIDLSSGKVKTYDHQHDEAWIGGPGISGWNMASGTLGFLKGKQQFYYQSEVSGYSHVYLYDISGKTKKALTAGSWEVHDVIPAKDGSALYVTANKSHPGNRSFYRLGLADQSMTPILEEAGAYEVVLSPDEKYLAYRYSNSTKPWELFVAPNKTGAKPYQITQSTTAQFKAITWQKPEVIAFRASDSIPVHARLYRPRGNANGAAVIFVHGAGYLQNAHQYWSQYYREYMFHNLLSAQGYTVLDIDYRASEGYGRDFRTAIYRSMGGKDLSDQLDGRQYLIDSLGIDPERIGIYGGSYGGFITLMALFKHPGAFQCGAALRAVTDWQHYNHEYTSNILNYPETDPEAYRFSSPIYYADQLEDRLLILHGMVDDNVQFQDVVRLSQRLIELGKTNWELAVYPTESHGFKTASSWYDEYRRIYDMFNEELLRK